ncbi:thioredoxin H9 [Artemisia annua]|uniref:Thioredoxin H9 n=1 Tax=Artemisia annua TaxID=35608 RepID=A0A2U1PR04_ARTAN|nr:thioredoxin H9 [Artemisia annua]
MGNCCPPSSKEGDDKQSTTSSLASGKVTLIETVEKWEEKLSEANKNGKMIVLNFSASWCSPCRAIAPIFCDLAAKHDSLMFLTVDVDELTEFSTSWEIKATPTFFFLKDGQQVDRLVGANEEELIKKTEAAELMLTL